MGAPAIELIGGESPWEIVRAYSYITVRPVDDGARFEIRCRTPDGSGRPFVHALEVMTAEEERRFVDDVANGREPAGPEEQCTGRALAHLVRLVEEATGAVPPAWPMFYDEAHGRGRHPSAQAERVGRRRPRRRR